MNAVSLQGSHPLTRPFGLLGLVLVGLLVSLLMVSPARSEAKMKQPSCGKFQKQVKKAKGNKKLIAKMRLKQCKADRLVYGQVKNSHFYGYRTDGVLTDNAYCANGNWVSNVGLGGKLNRTGWRVTDAKVKNKKKFTAVIEGKIKGGSHVIGIERRGNKWLAGWEYFGEVRDAGPVEKKNARPHCG